MLVSPVHLRRAVAVLRAGGLLAYPTEAVWGVGCDPLDDRALLDLLRLKQRDPAKGLILVAADWQQVAPFLRPPPAEAMARAQATWPGAATWVFPAGPLASPLLTGRHPGLAVRVSAHPVVRALCQGFGGPIVSSSANLSDRAPARSRAAVVAQFGPSLVCMPGPLGGATRPTPVRDALTGEVFRA